MVKERLAFNRIRTRRNALAIETDGEPTASKVMIG
jgi:hypothetical protein